MATTKKMRISRWYGILAIQFLNVFLALVVLNVGLFVFFSIFDYLRGGSPEEKERLFHGRSLEELSAVYPEWTEEDLAAFLVEDDNMAWVFDPWSQMKIDQMSGQFINVSEQGFRRVKDQGSWPPDPTAINVFVFGGSTSFGVGVPDDQTIASFLQEFLRGGDGAPIFVYNFGRPGSFSTTERFLFEHLLNGGTVPDVAIFIDGLNEFPFWNGTPMWTDQLVDLVNRANERRELISRSWYLKSTDLLRHVPMYRVARTAKGQLNKLAADSSSEASESLRIGTPPYEDRPPLEEAIDRWLLDNKLIEFVADEFNVQTVFVWQPVPVYQYDVAYHPLYEGDPVYFGVNLRTGYGYTLMDEMRPTLDLGSNFLWLADMQVGRKENLYVDPGHYTGAFSKEIASRIYDDIRQQGLLATN